MSIDISHIFRSKYCFFLNSHTWSFLRHAQSHIDLRIARNFEFERNNLYLQKSQRHGQVHQGVLYKIVSKALVLQCWSKSKYSFKYSTRHIVCHVVGNLDKSPWSVITFQALNKAYRFCNFNVQVMNKMEKKDSGESLRVHSMLRFSIMLIALRTLQIMINFIWNI